VVLELPRTSSRVLQCLEPLKGQSQQEKWKQAVAIANRGELKTESFSLLLEDDTFGGTTHRDLIIVFSKSLKPHLSGGAECSLQKPYISILRCSNGNPDPPTTILVPRVWWHFQKTWHKRFTTLPAPLSQELDAEDPWTVATIDSLSLYEVRGIKNICSTLHERFAAE